LGVDFSFLAVSNIQLVTPLDSNLAHMRRKTRSNPRDPEDYVPLENPEQLIASRNLRERQFNDLVHVLSELPSYGLHNPCPVYRYTSSPD